MGGQIKNNQFHPNKYKHAKENHRRLQRPVAELWKWRGGGAAGATAERAGAASAGGIDARSIQEYQMDAGDCSAEVGAEQYQVLGPR